MKKNLRSEVFKTATDSKPVETETKEEVKIVDDYLSKNQQKKPDFSKDEISKI